MESKRRKQIAKAAVLAATIAGGAFMFASPYEAKASSGAKAKAEFAIMQVQWLFIVRR